MSSSPVNQLLIAKNQQITQQLLPFWKRAISRLVSSSTTSPNSTAVFDTTFQSIVNQMTIPFASHQEQLDFLAKQDRDRTVMKRAYHNINHVLELCQLFENEISSSKKTSDRELQPEADIIFLTAFFHDVIYDAKKGDNEEKSDEMWKEFISSLMKQEEQKQNDENLQSIQSQVSEIILATKSHLKWKPSTKDEEKQTILNIVTFLDMDLAILGSSPERYKEYATQIKIEYQHIAPKDFCKGRLSFLEGMVTGADNKSPFFTETMRNLRGEQTMKNLKWEMEELKKEEYL